MKIFKTESQATLAAKRQALDTFPFDVDRTTDAQWLITDGACRCDCGDAPAVCAIFFDAEGPCFGKAGYCETCGEQG